MEEFIVTEWQPIGRILLKILQHQGNDMQMAQSRLSIIVLLYIEIQ